MSRLYFLLLASQDLMSDALRIMNNASTPCAETNSVNNVVSNCSIILIWASSYQLGLSFVIIFDGDVFTRAS